MVALTAQLSDKGEVVIRMSARVSQARVLAGDLLTDHTHLLLDIQSSFLSIEVRGKIKPRLAKDHRLFAAAI